MKKEENIFDKSIEALKNQQVPPGPSDELLKATIEKMNRISEQPETVEFDNRVRLIDKIDALRGLAKFAVAAVFLIITGFAAGRFSSPRPLSMEQIQASLEPKIRNELLGEMKQHMQLGLANSYIRLKDDLTEQYRHDLNQLAANIVTTSGNMTNQLLENLIESIDTAQTKEREHIIATLEQIELNRRRDTAQLSNAFANFAKQTENELYLTKENMAKLFEYAQYNEFSPDESEKPNIIN